MENQSSDLTQKSNYNFVWQLVQAVLSLAVSAILFGFTEGINSIASGRVDAGLLVKHNYTLFHSASDYSFALYLITMIAMTLMEMKHKSGFTFIQRILVATTLCSGYLLTLSFAEHIPFAVSYAISTVMCVCLIGWFLKEIFHKLPIAVLGAGIVALELIIILVLVYIGNLDLIICSLTLFVILAILMYCTVSINKNNNTNSTQI